MISARTDVVRVVVRCTEGGFLFEAMIPNAGSQHERHERGRWAIDLWNPDNAGLRRVFKRHYPNADIVIEQ